LVGNAIKFTPEGGEVTVDITARDDGFAQICVVDTGCGIAPYEVPRVFNEFSKVESAVPGSQGAQLGLFITKSLVKLHGGHIWVVSQLGVGSRFCFTIPYANESTPSARAS
jgi:two-component system sensor histidine kinase/response regulator